MKCLILLTFVFYFFFLNAQLYDAFSDGDFTNLPAWEGTADDFTINPEFQLQTSTSVAGSSYLSNSFPNVGSSSTMQWDFWIRIAFSPSSNNYCKVYLSAEQSDLSTQPDGFFLQFGEAGSHDAIRLFKRLGGNNTEICTGTAGQIASGISAKIRVIRDDAGNWKIMMDESSSQNYLIVASGTDQELLFGNRMGFLCTYTASNSSKFYFDDIYAGKEIVDVAAPVLKAVKCLSNTKLELIFDDNLDAQSAEDLSHFVLLPNTEVQSADLVIGFPDRIRLRTKTSLLNGKKYQLKCKNIADQNGNIGAEQVLEFDFLVHEKAQVGDVIINEIMCDPSPSIGLPEVEYIELYNTSERYFHLDEWIFADETSETKLGDGWLYPGQYILVCSPDDIAEFPNAMAVKNFPSLNNSAEQLSLKDEQGKIIDQVAYTDKWYQDADKKNGGFSLERIHSRLICSTASNWIASNAEIGGTPAAINSVQDNSLDQETPAITAIKMVDSLLLSVHFSEPMDSTSLANCLIFIDPEFSEKDRKVSGTYPDSILLELHAKLLASKQYGIRLIEVADCSQNFCNLSNNFVVPEVPKPSDLVINEILVDPLTGGSDFVELLNVSDKWIDLQQCGLARWSKDTIADWQQIENKCVLKKGEYALISSDTLLIQQSYTYSITGKYLQSNLPSYSNDSGTVYLICHNEVIDAVSYNKDWHFELLKSTKGKSLERIDPLGKSSESSNWHTAAETVRFATPAARNSQFYSRESKGEFSYGSILVSPDNDGFEDVLHIYYEMISPGWVASFSIYNAVGQLITKVIENELLGTTGNFTWNGLNDANEKVTVGTYIGVFEAFNTLEGSSFVRKKAFAVATHL